MATTLQCLVCLGVFVSLCLRLCLSLPLSVCVSACLPVYLPVYLSAWLSACVHFVYVHTCPMVCRRNRGSSICTHRGSARFVEVRNLDDPRCVLYWKTNTICTHRGLSRFVEVRNLDGPRCALHNKNKWFGSIEGGGDSGLYNTKGRVESPRTSTNLDLHGPPQNRILIRSRSQVTAAPLPSHRCN